MAYLFKHTPAADQLRRQPDVPDPDREPRGRPAGAARPEIDPLALPALPARGRHSAARARARGAQEAHPHPRGLREGLRRARRDHPDHPQVGRQGRRRREDHEAVRARRRADRRDPRAEDLPRWRGSRSWSSGTSSRKSASARGRSARLLKDEDSRWTLVRSELEEIQQELRQERQAPHADRQRHAASPNTPPTTSSSRRTTS